jgi:hypothetical protein
MKIDQDKIEKKDKSATEMLIDLISEFNNRLNRMEDVLNYMLIMNNPEAK